MYFCELGDVTVVGSSPEALVKLGGGVAQSCGRSPARGPRGRRARGPSRSRSELRADPKENAEHVMLVDLARNDLGRVARAGSRARRPVPLDRALQPRHAHRERRAAAGSPRAATPSTCSPRLSRRHAGRRAQGARHADHRRARTRAPRALRRHGRLLRLARRHGPGHHDPHAGVPRRHATATRRARASWPTACPAARIRGVLAKSASAARRARASRRSGL